MRRLRLQVAIAVLTVACASGFARAQDTTSADKKFVTEASLGSLAEINYAKLALQKSQDKNVREFAQKMITDHSKLIEDMKPFAHKLGVKESSSPKLTDDALYAKLKLQSGTSFDRAYVEAMVKDHHNDLKEFMEEESSTSDPALKAAVAKGEKVIRQHTEMIDNIAHMGGIETPGMPSGM